jgi:hypothetical protein
MPRPSVRQHAHHLRFDRYQTDHCAGASYIDSASRRAIFPGEMHEDVCSRDNWFWLWLSECCRTKGRSIFVMPHQENAPRESFQQFPKISGNRFSEFSYSPLSSELLVYCMLVLFHRTGDPELRRSGTQGAMPQRISRLDRETLWRGDYPTT